MSVSIHISFIRCGSKNFMFACSFFLAIALSILLLASALHAQSDGEMFTPKEATKPHVHFPSPRSSGAVRAAVGLRLLTLPQDIVEDEINKAPALDAVVTVGLPWQFEAGGSAVLQYVTNQFRAGGRWTHRLGDFGIGVGYDIGLWFGFVDFEGFDNRANGWTHYPNLALGYDLGDVLLTVKAEAIWLHAMRTFAGENEVRSTRNRLAGSAVTVVLEQPFWKDTHASLGVRLSLTEFHYQSWFAFSTFERKLLFSELMLGILL
jgi:hypothetical protein